MAARNSVSAPKKKSVPAPSKPKQPAKAQLAATHQVTLTKYEELHQFIESFAHHNHRLLIVLSGGGTGKSKSVETLCPNAKTFEGKVTAWNFYQFCLRHRGTNPICLSDLSRKSLREIQEQLRQLTDSKPIRRMFWLTDAAKKNGLPQSFATANPVIILSNSWDSSSPEAQALETRSDAVIRFEPTPQEVHRQVAYGKWFHDQEVFDFMAEHLQFVSEPSFRHYTQGSSVRKAALKAKAQGKKAIDWKAIMLEWLYGSETKKVVALLLADKTMTDIRRAKEFAAKTGQSERTYWRLKKHFRFYLEASIGKITLPKEPSPLDIEAMLAEANADILDDEGDDEEALERLGPPVVVKPKKKGTLNWSAPQKLIHVSSSKFV